LKLVTGVPPGVPTYQVSSIRGGLQFTQAGLVPSGGTYQLIVSKTDLGNVAENLTSVLDIVNHSEATERQARTIEAGESRSVSFTGLAPDTEYYVYAIALKQAHRIPQAFNPRRYAVGSADSPNIPSFTQDGTYTVSGAFRVRGSVPAGETYHVLVSHRLITGTADKVVDGIVTGLDGDQYSETLSGGGTASATFTDLVPGLAHHVYVLVENSSDLVYQYISVKSGGLLPTKPEAPSYRVYPIRGGLQFTQLGLVLPDQTYHVFVSKTKIANLSTNLASVRDAVRDGNQTARQTQSIGVGKSPSVSFTGLTPGAAYYVYAVAVKSVHQVWQDFDPEKYTAGSISLAALPNFKHNDRYTANGVIKVFGDIPANETYHVIVSQAEILDKEEGVTDSILRVLKGGSEAKFQTIDAQRHLRENQKLIFTDLIAGAVYRVYVVAANSSGALVVQHFGVLSDALPLPEKPNLEKDRKDIISGSLSLSQTGNVPFRETYYVLLSGTEIKVAEDKVEDVILGHLEADQYSVELASGAPRRVVFRGLRSGGLYYVYVIAANVSGTVVQTLKLNAGGKALPAAPSYEVSPRLGALRFTQEGNIPVGETYYVIASKTTLSDILFRIGNRRVVGVGDDENAKFVVISAGELRTTELRGLTPGTNYYVYAVAVGSGGASVQVFDPSRYTTDALGSNTSTLGQEKALSSLILYPNPSSGVVYISGSSLGEVLRVYTASGKFLGDYLLDLPGAGVDLSALDAGLYILEHKGIRHRVIIE
ncbi:MAG: T9SS type A sorting domain-containing protein, partial [Cytophagales bacterium]|nr:T9SS type A sorting domain-containing protein [Cytophagales bacterium]